MNGRLAAVCLLAGIALASDPDILSLSDLNGNPQTLEQYRGRVVVLNFWVTWCVPCREEMPLLVNIQNRYEPEGVVVIGASADDEGTQAQIPSSHLEDSLLPVFGDRIQLRQLLLNLVMNGIEAAGKGPHEARLVVIMTRNDAPSDVRLEVSDSGIGIEPGDRERIFHPFFTTKEAGLGMGLSISRTIVESHGGRILVEPNQPHGTRFLVLLPNERMT